MTRRDSVGEFLEGEGAADTMLDADGDNTGDAGDGYRGCRRFGTTAAEEALGQSLDQRLAEEVPDGDGHDPVDDVVADDPDLFGGGRDETDDTVLADAYGDPEASDDEIGDDSVGRLVAPDEGAHGDEEKDEVASDVGRDGGDLSAEEAALHLDPDS